MSNQSRSARNARAIMHYTAVKNAIKATLNKLRKETEERQAAGKLVADYSLGFANAMVMVEHHLEGREGPPTFYDHNGSVGQLPKPVKFTHEMQEEENARAEFDAEMGQIIAGAKDLLDAMSPFELAPEVTPVAMKLSDLLKKFDEEELNDGDNVDDDSGVVQSGNEPDKGASVPKCDNDLPSE